MVFLWNLSFSLFIPIMHILIKEITFKSLWPSWSYGSWIYHYLCNQCLSPYYSWEFESRLCDKGFQWLTVGRWFSPGTGTPVSSTNKTDRHDINEILLKVALITINQTKPIMHILIKEITFKSSALKLELKWSLIDPLPGERLLTAECT